MANAYQRIRQRKIYYVLAIVLLLGTAYAHKLLVIDSAATRYDISETNLGKVDMGGSISRFVLSSFRGPLVCGLWWEVNTLQEKHDYKQLELILTALTKLQPHYKGPWQYQGWNLAYNVSVEFDRIQDKYFYVSKGLRWLANGEEVNRLKLYDPNSPDEFRTIGDPEMRSTIGQYLSGKMYFADEKDTFRPLLHLSCIPPAQRKSSSLRNNPEKLEQFKAQYPRLVHRIRKLQNIPDGDEAALNREVLAFLEEHKEVPSLWSDEDGGGLKLASDPWPRWPNMADREVIGKVAEKEIHQDGLDIARLWYEFSTEMLPPPKTELSEDVVPQENKYTRVHKHMHSMIFRAKPSQTQARSAVELYNEGWPELGQEMAEKAYSMWMDLGKSCNIEKSAEQLKELFAKSTEYQEKYHENAQELKPPPGYLKDTNPSEYEKAMVNYKAFVFQNNWSKLRSTCRYDYWTDNTAVIKTDVYREAARCKYLAEERYTDWPVSIANYQKAIGLLSLGFRKPMSTSDQMALRCTLLAPGISSVLAQVTPAVSNQLSMYGADDTVQGELLDLQDKYMRTIARYLAPDRLRAEYQTWALKQALSQGLLTASNPLSLSIPSIFIPSSAVVNIDWAEDLVENERGPFDDLIPPMVKANRERDKVMNKK
ncbi:MAG: hypothetical protein QM703_20545 [Gemmatales bacterium]